MTPRVVAPPRAVGAGTLCVCACVALLATAHGAGAQSAATLVSRTANDNVTIRAVRLTAPLTLDGRLDEAVYRDVAPVTDFIQQEPQEGQPATEKTEAWVLFDDENLYVCARNWDSHPEREVANVVRAVDRLAQGAQQHGMNQARVRPLLDRIDELRVMARLGRIAATERQPEFRQELA